MALRARLVAPPPEPRKVWPWHTVKSASILASTVFRDDRRMEAETYLSSGFGIRSSIEAKKEGWGRFRDLADTWMPGRLKGILVPPEHGTPFLSATQVFDVRPFPRKWVAVAQMAAAGEYTAQEGTILVTRSGAVGRAVLSYSAHSGVILSDDLLRVFPKDKKNAGWLYAFLRSPQARAMMSGAHYGHIIKHLETTHLDSLPVPEIDEDQARRFNQRVAKIIALRNEGHCLTLEAEKRFEEALGIPSVKNWGERGFSTRARALLSGRRRLEASVHNPGVLAIWRHLKKSGQGFTSLHDAGFEVWLPNRFRRIPAADGVWLLDSADLTESTPDFSKRIADGDFGDPYSGRVREGWVLMARSGQTYGIIGTTVLAGKELEGHVISDHVMRIKPGDSVAIAPGYVTVAMTHPKLGRPLVKALAYGSSIPEIDVIDIDAFEIVRLDPKVEAQIAELAERSTQARTDADVLDRKVGEDAGEIVSLFIKR